MSSTAPAPLFPVGTPPNLGLYIGTELVKSKLKSSAPSVWFHTFKASGGISKSQDAISRTLVREISMEAHEANIAKHNANIIRGMNYRG